MLHLIPLPDESSNPLEEMSACNATASPSPSTASPGRPARPVAELPDLGYTDVWSSEVDGADAFTPLVLVSAGAGCGSAPPSLLSSPRPGHPAQCAASLAAAAPGRVAIGIGASSDVIVERWNGLPFDRPLPRVRTRPGSCGPPWPGRR